MIDIATLAKQTGIPAHTLRYYETRGLIAPVSRSGLKRVFADDVVLKLQLIQLGAASGHVFGRHQFGLWPECRHGGETQRFGATSGDSGHADSTIANHTNLAATLAGMSA